MCLRRPSITEWKFMNVSCGCRQWRHASMHDGDLSQVARYHSIGSSFPRKLLHNGQVWWASFIMLRQHGIRQQSSPSFPTAASFNAPLADCCTRLYFTDVVTFCLQLGQVIRVGSTRNHYVIKTHCGLRKKSRGIFSSLAIWRLTVTQLQSAVYDFAHTWRLSSVRYECELSVAFRPTDQLIVIIELIKRLFK